MCMYHNTAISYDIMYVYERYIVMYYNYDMAVENINLNPLSNYHNFAYYAHTFYLSLNIHITKYLLNNPFRTNKCYMIHKLKYSNI